MRIGSMLAVALVVLISATKPNLYAHPGVTDNDGCHVCGDHCEKEDLYEGQFHCHQRNVYMAKAISPMQREACYAIENRRLIQITKKDGGYVLAQPHVFGIDSDGNGAIHVYKVGDDIEDHWETIPLADIDAIDIEKDTFDAPALSSGQQIDQTFDHVLCRLK